MEKCMRFPSLVRILQIGLFFTFASDQFFVTANHRSITAPGQEDNDFGRGLGLPKEHEYEGQPHHDHVASKSLLFRDEDSAVHDHDPAKGYASENGNRRQLRNKQKQA